jgi:HlyD family secretion protein
VASAEAELQRFEDISDQAKAAIEINRLTTSLDRARAAADLAAAELRQAREHLQRSVIAAPLKGVISAVFIEKGELLAPGRPVVEIVDLQQVRLQIELTPSEVAQLGTDPAVRVTSSAYWGETFAGQISGIHPKADPATRRVPVHVTIDNSAGRLRSGTFVDCEITCRTSHAKLLIPSKGVLHDFASDYCLVAVPSDDGFTVARREVSARAVADSVAVVEAVTGLAPGDLLILTHQQEIQPAQIVGVGARQSLDY